MTEDEPRTEPSAEHPAADEAGQGRSRPNDTRAPEGA